MTRLILIYAGPTFWDAEGRLGGNQVLPLTPEAEESIRALVAGIADPVSAIYTCRGNEACEQAARLIAEKFDLRIRDNETLAPMNLGLWQGLLRDELAFRYPTVFEQWLENPLAVTPPEGEPLGQAIERLRLGLARILRRNRGGCMALPLRPMSLQIVAGLLRNQSPEQVAAHLHESALMERMEIPDDWPRKT